MTSKIFKTQYSRTSAIRAIGIAAVLVLLLCAIFTPCVADAVCPQNYIADVEEQLLDWYVCNNYLNLSAVEEFVNDWKNDTDNYDFSYVESNPIVVAIVDTGINFNHELFQGKYDESGRYVDTDGIGAYDVFLRDSDGKIVSTSTSAMDSDGIADDDSSDFHGTHVAGIVATLIHKLNLEKCIKIMPIKASYRSGKDSKFSVDDLKSALDFALENGADVVNMSLTDTGISPGATSSYDLVTDDMAKKAVFCAAAGNGRKNIWGSSVGQSSQKYEHYPASSANVVGVMNYTTEENGKIALASSSNYGNVYDICLPGSKIYSADGNTLYGYKSLSGTSMATPIASFASALVMLKDRAKCAVSGVECLSAQEVATLLKNAYSSTIKKDGFELKIFDFIALLQEDLSLKIDCDYDKVELSINDIVDVTFSAFVYPESSANMQNTQWNVKNANGDVLKTHIGSSITLTAKNVGVYYISATLNVGDKALMATKQFEVSYYEYTPSEIAEIKPIAIGEDNCTINDMGEQELFVSSLSTLTLCLSDFDKDIVSPDIDVLWYVNGEHTASGDSFDCLFVQEGEYIVKAKINGIFTSELKIVVNGEIQTPNSADADIALKVCISALAVMIALGFVVSFLVFSIKEKK